MHNSVLPTPVGPRNRNEPIGRFGSDSPARERRIALDTDVTASFWPMTLLCKLSSIRSSLAFSPSNILLTGIPVQRESTSAISFSVTLFFNNWVSWASESPAISSCCSSSGIRPYCNSDIRLKSDALRAISRSNFACSNSDLIVCVPCIAFFSDCHTFSKSLNLISACSRSSSISSNRLWLASSFSFANACSSSFNWIIRRSSLSISSGLESICNRILEAASSIKSIALSGNCLSLI